MFQQKGLARLRLKLYEGSTYHVRVATQIGRFDKSPQREVLVIAVEPLRGGRGIEAFDCDRPAGRSRDGAEALLLAVEH